MPREFGRRTVLRGSLVVAAAGVLASCRAAVEAIDVTPPAPSPSTPTASPSPSSAPSSGRPALVESYGPNGTHYPDDAPWLGEAAVHEFVAECDWEAIAGVVSQLTATQVADGVVIRVRPGTLGGNGAKSGSPPVLAELGDAQWSRNVVICPLEGFASVTMSDGIRLDKCARLSLFGFESTSAFVLTQCASVQIGWSRFSGMGVTRGGIDIAFYELVLGFRRDPEDTAGVRPTENYEMSPITRIGCVFGPSVKPAGSGAHCDTIQMEGTGTGVFGPFLNEDCVDYGSSNAVELLSGGLARAEYRHCLILGGQLPWTVYPLQDGDYVGEPNAFSGGCPDVRLYDSTVVGAVGRMGFTEVQNSTLSYQPQPTQQPRDAGQWTVDESTAAWTRDDIMALQDLPDYSTDALKNLWAW